MSVNSSRPRPAAPPVVPALLPIVAVVFIAFLAIGLALPVLPLHVHQGLGLGAFMVGLVAGAQFAASLLSRFWAGHFADTRGAKRATVTGLLVAVVAGLLYLLSLLFVRQPGTSVTILRADSSGWSGADLASALVHAGLARDRGHRVWLLARLPRLWCGSGPSRAAAKPRSRHRSVHCFSRFGTGNRQPRAGFSRERERPCGVYFVSTVVVLCATAIAVQLLMRRSST
jgi:hypothetical protein